MTTTTKWTIQLGEMVLEVSADLARLAGFSPPYPDSHVAHDEDPGRGPTRRLAEALAEGFEGEAAVIRAVAIGAARRAEHDLLTARQKIAEIEAATMRERVKAEAIARGAKERA